MSYYFYITVTFHKLKRIYNTNVKLYTEYEFGQLNGNSIADMQ